MGKKLYVGNLAYSVSSSDLQEWFTPFGTVQIAQVIQDRDTGRSKGFGFVEMDTDAQAQAAIQGLNDHEHEGRWLIVSEAKPGNARMAAVSRLGFNGSRFRSTVMRPRVASLSFGIGESSCKASHQRKALLTTIHGLEPRSEQLTLLASKGSRRLREVESATQSFRCQLGKRFALEIPSSLPLLPHVAGKETRYVQDGDSVCVSLTQVTDLGATDPATGQALFRLSWKPLGQSDSIGKTAKRVVKPRGTHGKA